MASPFSSLNDRRFSTQFGVAKDRMLGLLRNGGQLEAQSTPEAQRTAKVQQAKDSGQFDAIRERYNHDAAPFGRHMDQEGHLGPIPAPKEPKGRSMFRREPAAKPASTKTPAVSPEERERTAQLKRHAAMLAAEERAKIAASDATIQTGHDRLRIERNAAAAEASATKVKHNSVKREVEELSKTALDPLKGTKEAKAKLQEAQKSLEAHDKLLADADSKLAAADKAASDYELSSLKQKSANDQAKAKIALRKMQRENGLPVEEDLVPKSRPQDGAAMELGTTGKLEPIQPGSKKGSPILQARRDVASTTLTGQVLSDTLKDLNGREQDSAAWEKAQLTSIPYQSKEYLQAQLQQTQPNIQAAQVVLAGIQEQANLRVQGRNQRLQKLADDNASLRSKSFSAKDFTTDEHGNPWHRTLLEERNRVEAENQRDLDDTNAVLASEQQEIDRDIRLHDSRQKELIARTAQANKDTKAKVQQDREDRLAKVAEHYPEMAKDFRRIYQEHDNRHKAITDIYGAGTDEEWAAHEALSNEINKKFEDRQKQEQDREAKMQQLQPAAQQAFSDWKAKDEALRAEHKAVLGDLLPYSAKDMLRIGALAIDPAGMASGQHTPEVSDKFKRAFSESGEESAKRLAAATEQTIKNRDEAMRKAGLNPADPRHQAMFEDAAKSDWSDALPATGNLSWVNGVKKGWRSGIGENGKKDFTTEDSRVFSNGALAVHPSLVMHDESYKAAVDASDATPEAKKKAMEQLPDLQEAQGWSMLQGLTDEHDAQLGRLGLGIGETFPQFQARRAQEDPLWTSKVSQGNQVVQYLKEQQARGAGAQVADYIATNLAAGAIDLGTMVVGGFATALGAVPWAGELLSETAASGSKWANDLSANIDQQTNVGGVTKTFGQIARMAPPLALLLLSRGAAGETSMARVLSLSGLQTGGAAFADIYADLRDQGKSHLEAWSKAAPGAIASGIVTAALTNIGGTEALITGAGRKAATKAIQGYWRSLPKAFIREGSKEFFLEELPDEVISQMIQEIQKGKDPSPAIQALLEKLPEFGAAVGLLGGAGGIREELGRPKPAIDPSAPEHRAALDMQLTKQIAALPEEQRHIVTATQAILEGKSFKDLDENQLASLNLKRSPSGTISKLDSSKPMGAHEQDGHIVLSDATLSDVAVKAPAIETKYQPLSAEDRTEQIADKTESGPRWISRRGLEIAAEKRRDELRLKRDGSPEVNHGGMKIPATPAGILTRAEEEQLAILEQHMPDGQTPNHEAIAKAFGLKIKSTKSGDSPSPAEKQGPTPAPEAKTQPKKSWSWKALTQDGGDTSGEIEADSQEEALKELRTRGLYPTSISEKPAPANEAQPDQFDEYGTVTHNAKNGRTYVSTTSKKKAAALVGKLKTQGIQANVHEYSSPTEGKRWTVNFPTQAQPASAAIESQTRVTGGAATSPVGEIPTPATNHEPPSPKAKASPAAEGRWTATTKSGVQVSIPESKAKNKTEAIKELAKLPGGGPYDQIKADTVKLEKVESAEAESGNGENLPSSLAAKDEGQSRTASDLVEIPMNPAAVSSLIDSAAEEIAKLRPEAKADIVAIATALKRALLPYIKRGSFKKIFACVMEGAGFAAGTGSRTGSLYLDVSKIIADSYLHAAASGATGKPQAFKKIVESMINDGPIHELIHAGDMAVHSDRDAVRTWRGLPSAVRDSFTNAYNFGRPSHIPLHLRDDPSLPDEQRSKIKQRRDWFNDRYMGREWHRFITQHNLFGMTSEGMWRDVLSGNESRNIVTRILNAMLDILKDLAKHLSGRELARNKVIVNRIAQWLRENAPQELLDQMTPEAKATTSGAIKESTRESSGGDVASQSGKRRSPSANPIGSPKAVKDHIAANFGKIATAMGVDLVANYSGQTARYVVSEDGKRYGGYIEFNPTILAQYSEGQIMDIMREEMIHAGLDKALLRNLGLNTTDSQVQSGQYHIDFYRSKIHDQMSPSEIKNLESSYTSTDGKEYIIGSEFARVVIQKHLHGGITEQATLSRKKGQARSKAERAILRLLEGVVDFMARIAKSRTPAAIQAKAVLDDALKILRRAGAKRTMVTSRDGDGVQMSSSPDTDSKNLAAVHNLSINNLRHVLKMGGLPVPSVAVVRADKPAFESFGDITLLAHPNLIDPQQDKSSKVFNADVYSPRYPTVETTISPQDKAKLTAFFTPISVEAKNLSGVPESTFWEAPSSLADDFQRRPNGLLYNKLAVYSYLRDSGKMSTSDSFARMQTLQNEITSDEMAKWATDLMARLGVKPDERIFKGYAPSGKRKYVPHTLANVAKMLLGKVRGGEGGPSYGVGSIRALKAKQFKSIKGIQSAREDIVDESTMQNLKDETDREFVSILEKLLELRDEKPSRQSHFTVEDDIQAMAEMGQDNMTYLRKAYGDKFAEAMGTVRPFLEKLRHMPTEYFEGKMQRIVHLDEFKAAVVPDNIPQYLVESLTTKGLTTHFYKKNDRESRKAAIQDAGDIHDVLFASAPSQPNSELLGMRPAVMIDDKPVTGQEGQTHYDIMANWIYRHEFSGHQREQDDARKLAYNNITSDWFGRHNIRTGFLDLRSGKFLDRREAWDALAKRFKMPSDKFAEEHGLDSLDLPEIAKMNHLVAVQQASSPSAITPEMDKAYMDAVNAGDMETAQKMVDSVLPPLPPMSQPLTQEIDNLVTNANDSGESVSRWLLLKQVIQDSDDKDHWASDFKKELEDLQIKLGVVEGLTRDQVDQIVSTSRKKYDFKRGNTFFVFKSWKDFEHEYEAENNNDSGNVIPLSQRFNVASTLIQQSSSPGFLDNPELDKELAKVADLKGEPEAFGQTFNLDGSVYNGPPGIVVTLASTDIPAGSLNAEAMRKAMAGHESIPGLKPGVFRLRKKPGFISMDSNIISTNEKDHANAIQFARDNNQESAYNTITDEEIDTGGNGETVLKNVAQMAEAAKLLGEGKPVDVQALAKKAAQPGSQAVRDIRQQFTHGIESGKIASLDMEAAKAIADFHDSAPLGIDDETRASYNAFNQETLAQYNALIAAGFKLEPWEQKGEPYKNSAEMRKDVQDNKHLYYFKTSSGLGDNAKQEIEQYPPLEDSGIRINGQVVPFNDLFRAVHDVFGHCSYGRSFSANGEFQAFQDHADMYSKKAFPALALETLSYNAWFNAGQHLRNPDGSLPVKGDANFKELHDRPYAHRRTYMLPQSLLDRAMGIRTAVSEGNDLVGDGRGFSKFFTDVTKGESDKFKPHGNYEPAFKLEPDAQEFQDERYRYRGQFDDHIATSIPGFNEAQAVVGSAIVKSYPNGATVLDIGASEGAFNKAITSLSNGKIKTQAIDPNGSMRETFDRMPQVKGATFDQSAFGPRESEGKEAWTEDDGTTIKFFDPKGQRFDVVHEAMVFQFISNTRNAQVGRVKELLKDDGVAIFEEKFGGNKSEYDANEDKKDREWKSRHYTMEQLEAKRQAVLNGGDQIEGMTALQVAHWEMERVLNSHFSHVVQFWDSGNFRGYMASNSREAMGRMTGNMQSTDSDFATRKTPRQVQRDEMPQFASAPDAEPPVELRLGRKGDPEAMRQRNVKRIIAKHEANNPEALRVIYKKGRDGKYKITPKGLPVAQPIEYDLAESALAKSVAKGMRGPARLAPYIAALSDKLEQFFRDVSGDPEVMAGKEWYRVAREKLARVFGEDQKTFSQLLAATSARTSVKQNFELALDAYNRIKDGSFDGIPERYFAAMATLEKGELRFNKSFDGHEMGEIVRPITFRSWLDSEGILPRKENGEKFNANSHQVLNVIAGVWRDMIGGPKTAQFSDNLSGASNEATIDVWAARTLHRLSNEGEARWRILPLAETGVNHDDFAIGQKAFKAASLRLKMNPDDLQGVLWFAEKRLWANRGWTRALGAELSDFSSLIDNIVRDKDGKLTLRIDDGQGSLFGDEDFSNSKQSSPAENPLDEETGVRSRDAGGPQAKSARAAGARKRGSAGPASDQVGLQFASAPSIDGLTLATINGKKVETGKPITFRYLHNLSSYTKDKGPPYKPAKDERFDRGYEPSGQYMTAIERPENDISRSYPDSYKSGVVTFHNPIVIKAGEYGEESSWKRAISKAYGNKSGKRLSRAVIASGHDGIITVHPSGNTGEIVDLTTFDESKALFASAPDYQAPSPPARPTPLQEKVMTDPQNIRNATRIRLGASQGFAKDIIQNENYRAKAATILRNFERDIYNPMMTYMDDLAPREVRKKALLKIVDRVAKNRTPEQVSLWRKWLSWSKDERDSLLDDSERVREAKELLPFMDNISIQGPSLPAKGVEVQMSPSPNPSLPDPRAEMEEVRKRYQGTPQWMKAPNGKPTKLSEHQWLQVRTPQFKQWFGDWEKWHNGKDGYGVWADANGEASKVVDENGEPMVMFHGSRKAGFNTFDMSKAPGQRPNSAFFSNNRRVARTYSGNGNAVDIAGPNEDQDYVEPHRAIYETFLNIRNPHEVDFEGANWDGSRHGQFVVEKDGEQIAAADGKMYFDYERDALNLAEQHPGSEVMDAPDQHDSTNSVASEAEKYHNDGAIIRDVRDDGGEFDTFEASDIAIVFDPNQVKDAVGNNGNFSRDHNIQLASSPDNLLKRLAKHLPSDAEMEALSGRDVAGDLSEEDREVALANALQDHDKKTEKVEQWEKDARKMIAKDRNAVIKQIMENYFDGASFGSPELAMAASILQPILMREALASGEQEAIRKAHAFAYACGAGATQAGRELRALANPHRSSKEHVRDLLGSIFTTIPTKQRGRIAAAPSPAAKSRKIAELEKRIRELEKQILAGDKSKGRESAAAKRQLAQTRQEKDKEQLIEAYSAARRASIVKELAAEGLTEDDIFLDAEDRIAAHESEPVTAALALHPESQHDAIRYILRGYSHQEISKMTGMPVGQIAALHERFRNQSLKKQVAGWVSRGKSFLDMVRDGLKKAFGIQQASAPAPWQGIKGSVNPALSAEIDRQLAVLCPTATQANSGRLLAQVVKGAHGHQVTIHVKFSPDDFKSVYRVARTASIASASAFDKLYEFWINNLLSGIMTNVVNLLGNTTSTAIHFLPSRFLETGINIFMGGQDAAQLGEWRHIAAGIMPGIQEALKNAVLSFSAEADPVGHKYLDEPMRIEFSSTGDIEKIGGYRGPSVGGRVGRIIRIPGRMLRVMDAMYKTFIMHCEVGAQAYRIAKAAQRQGTIPNTPAALQAAISSEIKTPGSASWKLAMRIAEDLLFQGSTLVTDLAKEFTQGLDRSAPSKLAKAEELHQQGSHVEAAAMTLRANGLIFASKILSIIFPFVKTPANILTTGIRKSPLGSVWLAAHVLTAFGKGIFNLADGKAFSHNQSSAYIAKLMSEQMQAYIVLAFIFSAVEGDDDDDDKPMLLVGGRPYQDTKGRAELYTKYGGTYSVVVQGKDGQRRSIPFAKYEPVATILGIMIDGIRRIKESSRRKDAQIAGESNAAVLRRTMGDLANQFEDKSFLQGFSTIYREIDAIKRDADTGKGVLESAKKQLVTALVPNLVRQSLRNLDDTQRDSKKKNDWYDAFPFGSNAEPLIDYLGRDVEKDQFFPGSRLFLPSGSKVGPHHPIFKHFSEWNDLHPDEKVQPSPMRKTDYFVFDADGKTHLQLTEPKDMARFERMVGNEFAKNMETIAGNLSPDTLPPNFKHLIDSAKSDARLKARTTFNESRSIFKPRP